jgi:hypothetical protein
LQFILFFLVLEKAGLRALGVWDRLRGGFFGRLRVFGGYIFGVMCALGCYACDLGVLFFESPARALLRIGRLGIFIFYFCRIFLHFFFFFFFLSRD